MAVLVGKQAPDIQVSAVKDGAIVDTFSLAAYRGQYVVLFFYPLDFTFVCPTELHEFQAQYAAFKKLNCEIIGASTDSAHSHLAWLRTKKAQGGIEGVSYPLIADFNKTLAQAYDVLLPEGMALRASFLIDKAGMVQAQNVNNLPLGRSVDEMLRLLQALQFTEKHGEVCPANWSEGKKGMKATAEGVRTYFGG